MSLVRNKLKQVIVRVGVAFLSEGISEYLRKVLEKKQPEKNDVGGSVSGFEGEI